MATRDSQLGSIPTPIQRQQGYPVAGRRFDLLALGLALWVLIGVFVDVNAHNHGQVDNTFFTPWHLLLYSGVVANGLLLGIAQYRNIGQGYAWQRSLPQGYGLSQIGVLIFALGGGFDFVWHEVFGFEVNLEALLSPSHLILATGGLLFIVGPLRAQWGRAEGAGGWGSLFPAILSATATMSIITLFTQFAHVILRADEFAGRRPGGNSFVLDASLSASVLIPAVIMTATILLLVRRWRLPFGTLTVLLGLNGLLMFYLYIGFIERLWPILLAPLFAGLVGDLLIWRLNPSLERVASLRLLAFLVPLVYMLSFFVILMLVANVWWTIHLWMGASFMAGSAGLGMSYLLAPPVVPETVNRD